MAYVREKKVPGKGDKAYSYYQLVEGKRVNGKVVQRVIAHLGRHDSIEDARAAASDVVPKANQPAEPKVEDARAANAAPNYFHRLSPDILNSEDAVLRKMRKRLRAAASRRSRKIDEVQVAAHRQGYTLTDNDWTKIEEILSEVEELTHDADQLSAELEYRRLSAGS